MSNKKLYSVIWAAVVGMSVLSLNSFAAERNYVAGSRAMANIDVTLGGAVTCTMIADAVKGQVGDVSIPFTVESVCSLNGTNYTTAVGFSRADEGSFTVDEAGARGVAFNASEDRSINVEWDETMTVNAQGSATDDSTVFIGPYVVIDPGKSTKVTGLIKPVGDALIPGAYSVPLVSAMYTN